MEIRTTKKYVCKLVIYLAKWENTFIDIYGELIKLCLITAAVTNCPKKINLVMYISLSVNNYLKKLRALEAVSIILFLKTLFLVVALAF